MIHAPLFQDGDHVELLDGAPTPRRYRLQAGARGQVLFTDPPRGDYSTAWVAVLFGHASRPICLQARWLRRVGA
jgi:hypothetical protein